MQARVRDQQESGLQDYNYVYRYTPIEDSAAQQHEE